MQRTQDLLHGALASLIHEKTYDAIVVKEILARANVGRSTFYTHFRDKDELLESGIRDVLRTSAASSPTRAMGPADRVLRFSLPVFEHIERYRSAGYSAERAQGQAVVHAHLQRVLVDSIGDDLRRAVPHHPEIEQTVPCDLLAQHVASTFVVVLNWWVESAKPLPSRQVNELFRALTRPIVTNVVGP